MIIGLDLQHRTHLEDAFLFSEAKRWDVNGVPGALPCLSRRSAPRRHQPDSLAIDFVVNRAPGKLYIQSAYEMPTKEKEDQELLSLRRTGDFFRKMVIVRGYEKPRIAEDGIITVGAIPFLLDETIMDKALGK